MPIWTAVEERNPRSGGRPRPGATRCAKWKCESIGSADRRRRAFDSQHFVDGECLAISERCAKFVPDDPKIPSAE